MGKHSEKDNKNKRKPLWVIPVIIVVVLIILFVFSKEIGYTLGWIVGSIARLFK